MPFHEGKNFYDDMLSFIKNQDSMLKILLDNRIDATVRGMRLCAPLPTLSLASVAICKGVKKTKPPGPHDLGGWKKALGVDLLSHARVRSIMGDEALNYRVRNGVGCTRLSMDAKETSKYRIDREKRSFENTRLTGY